MDLSTEQVAALTRSISPVRLSTYLTASGGSESGALGLYLWDRKLSVAFLADLALPLDDRSFRQLADAWSRISGEKTPGRVVAQCMFGLLARPARQGGPRRSGSSSGPQRLRGPVAWCLGPGVSRR